MKKISYFLFAFFILELFSLRMFAQSISDLEINLNKLQVNLKLEQSKLDSLKNILNERAKKIDLEKKKINPDNNAIASLMSGSISISNEVAQGQMKVENLENKIESVKKQLSKKYSAKIDSLQELEKNGNLSSEELNKIKTEILTFIEKKMLAAPKASLLSFNPGKIAAIDLKKLNDPEEKEIYNDYLQNALTEVNSRLDNVDESITEVNQILTLQKKTRRFLEETEFETNIQQQSAPATQSYQTSPDNVVVKTSDARSSFYSQAQDYSLLLGQLRLPSDAKFKWDSYLDPKHPGLTLQQYQDLLKEVKKKLLEYRLILTHKLGMVK